MDLSFFLEHGYQALPGVIDRGVIERLLEFLAADADDALTLLMADLGLRRMDELNAKVDQAFAQADRVAIPRDRRQVMTGIFPLETRLSRTLWMVPKLPRVRQVIEESLKHASLFMHVPPTARFAVPQNRHAIESAHQDASLNPYLTDFVTLWVPLVPITDDCGGIEVSEGSQPMAKPTTAQASGTGSTRRHCTLELGDALLMNKCLMHETRANVSNHIRFSIEYHFFSGRDSSSKHMLDMQTWKVIDPAKKSAAA